MKIIAIVVYTVSMTCANLLISVLGPWVSPINSFFLIGLDLALRDWLHYQLKPYHMMVLICFSGLLTYILAPSAGIIAVASASAFTAAALADWAVFYRVRGTWFVRSNTSNVAGAAVDSLLFPTIAFGAIMPEIVLLQFSAKVSGGAIWAVIIKRILKK